MQQENWKPWPTQPDIEVSNLGRVRRNGRVLVARARQAYVAGSVKVGMYPRVSISQPGGKRQRLAVHRLVCDAWLGPLPPGMHRAHLNGDVTDNRLSNLAIVTPRTNMREHRVAQGLAPIYVLSDEDLKRGLEMYAQPGVTARDVERKFGLSLGGFHYHVERLGLLKPHGGKLTHEQRADAVRRIRSGETIRSVALSVGMSENGLANSLRAAGELEMPKPLRKVDLLPDTRAAILAERARGDRIVEIAARHGVGIGTVQAIVGRTRTYKGKHIGDRGEEMRQAAKTMGPRQFAEVFNVPLHTAKYHIRMARHDTQENTSSAA